MKTASSSRAALDGSGPGYHISLRPAPFGHRTLTPPTLYGAWRRQTLRQAAIWSERNDHARPSAVKQKQQEPEGRRPRSGLDSDQLSRYSRAHPTVSTPALLFCLTAERSSDRSVRSRCHPALPMPVVTNRLKCLHLHQASRKALKLFRPGQLAVQPRGTGLKRVFTTRDQIFHVQQDPKIAAKTGAVFMCDAGKQLKT